MFKEVSQLVDADLFVPQDPRNLTQSFQEGCIKIDHTNQKEAYWYSQM